MEDFLMFLYFLCVVFFIALYIRIWFMAEDVNKIKKKITFTEPKSIEKLLLLGEIAQAQKNAIVQLVNQLENIWNNNFYYANNGTDNAIIKKKTIKALDPTIERFKKDFNDLGFIMPEHLSSGENYYNFKMKLKRN